MGLPRRWIVAAMLLATLSQAACYTWEPIKPAEAPKLTGSFATPVGREGNTTIVAVRVVDVERPDGTLAQLKGEYDLRVTTRDGRTLEFTHPVGVDRDGDAIVVRGGNRAAVRYPLSDIASAEVSQYSPVQTGLLTAGIATVVTVVAFAILFSGNK